MLEIWIGGPSPAGEPACARPRLTRRSIWPVLVGYAFQLVIGAALSPPAFADLFGVDDASDICPENADPCTISTVVNVVDGAKLDFGTRAVEVIGAGRIDAGAGNVSIRCGHLRLATGTSTAIKLSGITTEGASSGGYGEVLARRRCSLDLSVLCLAESDCALRDAGTCSVGNGNIEVGGRIFGNADDPAVVSLRAAGDVITAQQIFASSTDGDGDGGTINIHAAGAVSIGARLQATGGPGATGGSVSIASGGDITVTAPLEMMGGDLDGGDLSVSAGRDFLVFADVDASSVSGGGFGGEISVSAVRDISIVGGTSLSRMAVDTDGHESAIDVFGGDGGTQDYLAGRDIRVGPFVLASSRGAPPDGYGDEISLDAGRDVLVEGKLDVKGKGSYGGGGYVTIYGGRTVYVTATSTFDLTGGDGGGEVTIDAVDTVTFDGLADTTTPAASVAGRIDISSSIGNVFVSGSLVVKGKKPGAAGDLVNLEGCGVQLFAGASILNGVASARTNLKGRERIRIEADASVDTDTGTNRFIYRDPEKAPQVNGTVTPIATLVVDASLLPCPVCGNGLAEAGETCDDGNRNNGDGCSALCQDEGCIADTVGYPQTSLCDDETPCTDDACDTDTHACVHTEGCSADDGPCTIDRCGESGFCLHLPDDSFCVDTISCTNDVCGSAGKCQHFAVSSLCGDGVGCTIDTCDVKLGCTHSPKAALCNDSNVCTSDRCDPVVDCVHVPVEQTCSDGLACTAEDKCVEGTCEGTSTCPPEEVCHRDTGTCGLPTTTTTTTTTITTTTTVAAPTTTVPTVTTTLPSRCGDGKVDEGEDCDSGDTAWSPGHACRDCRLLTCGDPDDSGRQTASDALFTLRAAVEATTCDCVCNTDGLGVVTASDALRILRKAVDLEVTFSCPCS